MLRKIPDSAVPFARDGVLSARRLGHVEAADRLHRHARKRATHTAASAQAEAERQFEEASRAGYRDGLERALSAWLPVLADVLEDEAQMKSRTRQALEDYLHQALGDAGIEAALIARCCETAAAADDAVAGAWTLYVPEDRGELVERLAETSSAMLQVRRGEAPWAVLERDDRVVEIDPRRPAARRLTELLDGEALRECLEQRAIGYAADTLHALRQDTVRKQFRRDHTGGEP